MNNKDYELMEEMYLDSLSSEFYEEKGYFTNEDPMGTYDYDYHTTAMLRDQGYWV